MNKLTKGSLGKVDLTASSTYNTRENTLKAAKDRKMSAIISKPIFDFEMLVSGNANYPKIAAALSEVGQFYPDFKSWFYFTFRHGLNLGERKILLAHSNGDISAISLLKDTPEEKKICTFFVLPEYRFMGLSTSLMERSLAALGGNNVSITVAEERNEDLKGTLSANEFFLADARTGAYRDEKIEFFYRR